MKRLTSYALLLLLLSGCARNSFTNDSPVKAADTEPLDEIAMPQAQPKTPGSLWTNADGSIFSDYKAKNVGDIIVVTIVEKDSASKEATTATGATSTYSAGISNLFGLENHTNMNLGALVNTNFKNGYTSDGKTARNGNLTAQLSVQVIGLYPNGNLKIRGGKEVMVNNETQVVYLTGIIRPVDVTAANTIDSNKILNARISYTGKGVIADQQSPGLLGRALGALWPF
ncbi:MAG: flagellar basal body L-ring protein FlgH [Desulfocapsaceae bacterium]|nr:flagellar basal body L-ring protein FlgH [Desulfocapsaceae bacterium]